MWTVLSCGVSTEQHKGNSITELIKVWLDEYIVQLHQVLKACLMLPRKMHLIGNY